MLLLKNHFVSVKQGNTLLRFHDMLLLLPICVVWSWLRLHFCDPHALKETLIWRKHEASVTGSNMIASHRVKGEVN